MIKGQSAAVMASGLFAARRMKSGMSTIETVRCGFYLLTRGACLRIELAFNYS
jgi:hypothetical protein